MIAIPRQPLCYAGWRGFFLELTNFWPTLQFRAEIRLWSVGDVLVYPMYVYAWREGIPAFLLSISTKQDSGRYAMCGRSVQRRQRGTFPLYGLCRSLCNTRRNGLASAFWTAIWPVIFQAHYFLRLWSGHGNSCGPQKQPDRWYHRRIKYEKRYHER